jgi:hypothetical protein
VLSALGIVAKQILKQFRRELNGLDNVSHARKSRADGFADICIDPGHDFGMAEKKLNCLIRFPGSGQRLKSFRSI